MNEKVSLLDDSSSDDLVLDDDNESVSSYKPAESSMAKEPKTAVQLKRRLSSIESAEAVKQ